MIGTWFLASLMPLACLCVTGTPSQLRLSHSGYEIISFNDHGPDESGSTKLEVIKSSPYEGGMGLPGLEKAGEASGSVDDLPRKFHQPKRGGWEMPRSTSRSQILPIIRHNMIEIGSKDLGQLGPRSADLYLTLGSSSRKLGYGENERKDFVDYFPSLSSADVNANSFVDDLMEHQRAELGNHGKVIATIMRSRMKEKKRDEASKSKIKLSPVDPERRPKSAGLPVIPNFPAIKVDHSGNLWAPSKSPGIYSPIYPSGIDVSADMGPTKSALPSNLLALKVNRPLGPPNEVSKDRSRDAFYDNANLDANVDYNVAKTVAKIDRFKDQLDKSNVTTFKPSLVIDILHEIAPPETGGDGPYVIPPSKREQPAVKRVNHEVESVARPHDLNGSSKKCKRMKSLLTPAFYQFLTKFSDLVFENALQYETNLQIRDSAVKFIDVGKKHMADDEFSSLII